MEIQANEIQKPNKKETTIERGNPSDSEIPEWLQEFRENLVDDEIPVHGDSHASSSHEASLEPTTKMRTWDFPKKRRKRRQGCSGYCEIVPQLGCVSPDSETLDSQRGKQSQGNPRHKVLGSIRRVRFTQSAPRQASIRENKGPSLGNYKSKFLISEVLTL